MSDKRFEVNNNGNVQEQKFVSIENVETLYIDGGSGIVGDIQIPLKNIQKYPFDREYYNLFVIKDETFLRSGYGIGSFQIGKERSLSPNEGTTREICNEFADLSDNAVKRIKTFPSLFMDENRFNGWAEPSQEVFFGLVNKVSPKGKFLEISFQILFPAFPQQELNETASEFGLMHTTENNELSRTHWAIKKVDLLNLLNNKRLIPVGAI